MSKLVDLTGQRFGRLTVVEKEGSRECRPGKYRIYWRCKCDCGNECSAHTTDLRAGKVKSCGCLRKEILDTIGERNRSHNRFFIDGNVVHVFFNNKPGEMLADLDVWNAWASAYCWHLTANGYAATGYNGKNTLFHNIAFPNCKNGIVADHINGNRLDNRMENLRLVNRAQNNMNKGLGSNNTSGHTGVAWDKSKRKWAAKIQIGGKTKYLGRYTDIENAIKARTEAEEKYFGEYRRKE